LAERTNLEAESSLLLKIFGISALIAFCGDLCRDLGESALANQLELLGRAEVLILLLPTLQRILAFSWELLT
jgi:stage III sporulation protein AD